MSNWIHCNSCFCSPGEINFYLTACGHMFCLRCIKKATDKKCPVCDNHASIKELTDNLDPEIQMYFTDPQAMLEQCLRVFEFQNKHRDKLFAYLMGTLEKYARLKGEYQKAQRMINDLVKDNHRLAQSIKQSGEKKSLYTPSESSRASPVSSFFVPSTNSLRGAQKTPLSGLFQSNYGQNTSNFSVQKNSGHLHQPSITRGTPASFSSTPSPNFAPFTRSTSRGGRFIADGSN